MFGPIDPTGYGLQMGSALRTWPWWPKWVLVAVCEEWSCND